MVFGATTFREFVSMLAAGSDDSDVRDPRGHEDEESAGDGGVFNAGSPLDCPDATVASGGSSASGHLAGSVGRRHV